MRYIELDSKQAFKQHFGGWLVTTDAFDLPKGVPGVQIHLPYLPLAQTSCRRRRTVITYYSNTPDHDSLRNPCWPVAATTEDQNRHKMAPESDGLVWTPLGRRFSAPGNGVHLSPALFKGCKYCQRTSVESSTDST